MSQKLHTPFDPSFITVNPLIIRGHDDMGIWERIFGKNGGDSDDTPPKPSGKNGADDDNGDMDIGPSFHSSRPDHSAQIAKEKAKREQQQEAADKRHQDVVRQNVDELLRQSRESEIPRQQESVLQRYQYLFDEITKSRYRTRDQERDRDMGMER